MKHKNVEVGQRVIIKRSTSATWTTAADHIGEEFTVISVEPLSYSEEGTVFVQSVDNAVVVQFWCNHRDLKRVKKEAGPARPEDKAPASAPRPFKIGDTVLVVHNPHDRAPVGTVGTVTGDDGEGDPVPFRVDTGKDSWYYHERDLKPLSLADIQAALDKRFA